MGGNSLRFNHAYAGNNPLNLNDPRGEFTFVPALAGALVGGGTSAFSGFVQEQHSWELAQTAAIGAGGALVGTCFVGTLANEFLAPTYPGTPDDFNPVFDVYCSPKCF